MGILRQPVIQMPTSSEAGSDEQDGFSGGVNPAAAVGIADPTQYAAITNMRLVRDGEMAKRPGLVSVGTLPGLQQCFLPYDFGVPGGAGRFLALINGTASSAIQRGVWQAGSPNTPSTPGTVTFSNVGTVSLSGPTFSGSAAQFRDATNDCLYVAVIGPIVGFTPGMAKWDVTGTWTENIAGAKVQSLQYLWVYNQRLFGCKPGSQTLYWSGLNNGDTMADTGNGGGSAQIRTFGGQNIVGGFALGATNYILHENAISSFRGLTFDDISITAGTQGISPNTGYPLAWNVIDHVGYILTMQGLVIVTEAGVSFYNTPSTPDPILQFLRTTVGYFDPKSYVVDNARRNEIWFYVGARSFGGASLSRVFIYNKRLQRFTGQATLGITPNAIWSMANDVGALHGPQLLMASATKVFGTDFVYDASNAYTDDGSVYPSSVQLRRFYTGKPSYQKAFRFLNVNMGGGASDTLTATGTSTGASVTYSTTAGGTVADTTNMKAQEVSVIQLSGQGSYLDATITDGAGTTTGWSVLRADVDAYILAQRAG